MKPELCPLCKKAFLKIDMDYMLNHYGTLWMKVPYLKQSVFCPHCEEAGVRGELRQLKGRS